MNAILIEMLIVCLAASLVVTACHRFKLPSIVGFILTGVVIGPSALGLVSSLPSAYNLAEIVAVILLFTIGLEFSLSKLRELRQPFLRLGALQVALTAGAIVGGGALFTDLSVGKLVLWGFAITLSSTALVLKLLHDYGDMQTPLGRNSLGILLFQDIAVIGMVILLPLFASEAAVEHDTVAGAHLMDEWGAYGWWFLRAVGVVAVLFVAARYVFPRLLEQVVQTRSQEVFFFSIIFICLGTGLLFHWIGLSLSLGAFVAGLIIAESAFGRHAIAIFGSLRDTSLGMFFITVGMLLNLQFLAEHLLTVIGIGLVFFFLKVFIVTAICFVQRIPLAQALLTGLTVCQVGEFSFLLVSDGMRLGIFSEAENQYFLAASVLSMIATPFIYIAAPRVVHRYFRLQWQGVGLENDVADVRSHATAGGESPTIIIGYGIAGQNVAEALSALRISFQILEMNYATVKANKATGLPITFGDATHPEVLEHLGLRKARMVVIAASGSETAGQIIHAVRAINPSIPIILRAQYVRDLKRIPKDANLRPVVAEIETASELVAHVLKNYGVSSRVIFEYTAKVRTQLNSVAESVSGNRYADLDLPSWDVLASLRAIIVQEGFYSVGKTLGALALPQQAGVSVVAVFRESQGTIIPDGDFQVEARDIIHLIGEPEKLETAGSYLTTGLTLPS